jgi:hypothetical protein
MRRVIELLYFFRVVPPISRLMRATFATLTVVGGAQITLGTSEAPAVILPVLVLQAFSAATGFAAPARRGYFDLLLARGESRVRIAVAQWLTGIAPGVGSWAALAALQGVEHGTGGNPLLAAGTLVALLMASTIPWAITVGLPRFSGAIGWLLLVCVGGATEPVWPQAVREVIFPLEVVGKALPGQMVASDAIALAIGVVVSVAALVLALAWVHRSDIPLEASQ